MELNTVILGDCIEVLTEMPRGKADCVIVDPPYSSGARQDAGRKSKDSNIVHHDAGWFTHDNMSTFGFQFFIRHFLISLAKVMKPRASGFLFIDWRQYPIMSQLIESSGFRINNLIVWDKMYLGLGIKLFRNQHELITFFSKGQPRKPKKFNVPNIIRIPYVPGNKKKHPTQKPVELLEILVDVATEPGELILDPMCGSGSTLVAAKKLGRDYLGIEINEAYVEVSKKWLRETKFIPKKISEFGGPR